MEESAAPSVGLFAHLELAPWKTAIGWLSAILISILFLSSGIWKITDLTGWAVRITQAKVPAGLSLPAAIGIGIAETMAGVLILVPRFRRWGAWVASLLLILFLGYFAINYSALAGSDCSCFPWLKRVVGPGFFIGDAVMLALAMVAGWWAKPSGSLRSAILVLAAVTVFAFVSYGVEVTRQTGAEAPATITVNGQRLSTHQGKLFIYFFNPECLHCLDAGKKLAKLNWGDTKLVGVATEQPQFATQFLRDSGLNAGISQDLDILKKAFPFVNAPAAVALQNGRQKAMLTQFEGEEPEATLKKYGFAH